jgi:hypothetical protein
MLASLANMFPRIARPQTAPRSHPIGRHRVEGSCPVGSSSTRKLMAARSTGQIQCATQVTHTPPGSDPGAVMMVYTAYSTLTTATADTKPTARNSHPIGWVGRREATTAPTVPNPGTTTTPGSNSERTPVVGGP